MTDRKGSNPPLGREAGLAMLGAMGLPSKGCGSVRISMEPSEIATVTVEYALRGEWLEAAGKAMRGS